MNVLDITEEEFLTDETFPDSDALLRETWPVPPEDDSREFELYLLDIGVRI